MPKTNDPVLPGLQPEPAPRKKRVTKSTAETEGAAPVVKKVVRRKASAAVDSPAEMPAPEAAPAKVPRLRKSPAKAPKISEQPELPSPAATAEPLAQALPAPVKEITPAPAPNVVAALQNPPDAIVEKGRGEGVIRVSHYPPYQRYSAPNNDAAPAPNVSTQSSYPPYPGNGGGQQNRQQGGGHSNQPQQSGNQRDGRFNNRRDQRDNRDQRNQRGRHDRQQNNNNREPRENRDNRDSHNNLTPSDSSQSAENQDYENYDDSAAQVQVGPYEPVFAEGLVEVSPKGFGFLREASKNYVQSPSDIFVTPEVIRRYLLRDGQFIKGETRRGSRGPQLFKLTEINGEDPERYIDIPLFEELTSINPDQRIKLETVPDRYTTRVIDLISPIGKGQRGLIVAPPRTGKTTLLQHIADGVLKNHPSMKLIILLVDERPEEVTEMRRTFPTAEIMASSNDSDLKSHTRICQLAIERAKRLVEAEEDVFILLDSITRVARAFNNATSGGGRTGSGGLDTRAMEIPRRLFAAARNTEQAGSLTIVATALVETGSLMDEVIFQEFKGTGNMELVLDRKISEQRIYPAVDIFKSGTRREELLLTPHDLEKINTIRRGLAGHRPGEAVERLLSFLRKFPTNSQMLKEIPVAS
ncbi:MAG: transcription termination factor Rho [Chthoniobacterales bacterium]